MASSSSVKGGKSMFMSQSPRSPSWHKLIHTRTNPMSTRSECRQTINQTMSRRANWNNSARVQLGEATTVNAQLFDPCGAHLCGPHSPSRESGRITSSAAACSARSARIYESGVPLRLRLQRTNTKGSCEEPTQRRATRADNN